MHKFLKIQWKRAIIKIEQTFVFEVVITVVQFNKKLESCFKKCNLYLLL